MMKEHLLFHSKTIGQWRIEIVRHANLSGVLANRAFFALRGRRGPF